jgi:hypothetical protein
VVKCRLYSCDLQICTHLLLIRLMLLDIEINKILYLTTKVLVCVTVCLTHIGILEWIYRDKQNITSEYKLNAVCHEWFS